MWETIITAVIAAIAGIIVKVWLGRGKSKDKQEAEARKKAMESVGGSLEVEERIRDGHDAVDDKPPASSSEEEIGGWNRGE